MTARRATLAAAAIAPAAAALLVLRAWIPRLEGARRVDFTLYFAAARIGIRHGWSAIYDEGLQRAEVASLLPGPPWLPYISPPHVAWLVSPLAALPADAAYAVWAGAGAAMMLVAVALASGRGRTRLAVALAASIAFLPFLYVIASGQVVPVVMLSVAASFFLLRRSRPWLAGVALAPMLSKPHLALCVPVFLLLAGQTRTVAAFAASAGLVAAASLVAIGGAGIREYLGLLALASTFTDQKVLTLGGQLGPGGTVLGVALAAVGARASWLARSGPVEIPYAAGVAASLCVAGYLNAPDAAIALLPIALLARLDLAAGRVLTLGLIWTGVELYLLTPFFMFGAIAAIVVVTWDAGRRLKSTAAVPGIAPAAAHA